MIQDFICPSWIHGKMNASEKLILAYIYDNLKHTNVKSVVIPSKVLSKVGEVNANAACAIGRKLEQMGFICRKNISVDVNGKKRRSIEYSLPDAGMYYRHAEECISIDKKPEEELLNFIGTLNVVNEEEEETCD